MKFSTKMRSALALALAFCAAVSIDAQTTRRATKKPTRSATQKKSTKKRTTRKPAARRAAPVPVIRYTSPRSAAALSADLGSMASRVRSGQFGIMAISLTRGDTLFTWNAGAPLLPASTMKMVTTAIAFERLGPRYQFSTDVLYDGTLSPDGTLDGNVYLRGDGDPSLSGRYMTGGPDAPIAFLVDQLVARGIRHITGSVIGDATAFDDRLIPEGWLTRYLQSGYAARVSALSLNENVVWVTIAPGGARLEPATNAIRLVSNVRTVPGGGARLSVRRFTDGSVQVSGTIGSRSPPRRYVYIVEDPAKFTTGALRATLIAKGITIDGGLGLGKTPSSAVKIASIQSPTLDRITPRTMTQMLGYAHGADWGPSFHASLPVAGESELLRRRMKGSPAQGNLHAKTGTTNDVIALGGYVTATNGEVIAFSFLYNGRDRWTAKSMIDVMGETLASFAR
jgi:D-alanyl-D-alanine carboxypeptidase/D-alanyl-D-alanine-endopeptidase (penicillin-binding protein 4)